MTTELVKSLSIENLLNQRDGVVANLHAACAALTAVDSTMRGAMDGLRRHGVIHGVADLVCTKGYGHGLRLHRDQGVSDAIRRFDALAWQHLIHHSGIRSVMDSDAREQWDKAIASGDVPELTMDNIASTFEVLMASRGEMFERGVLQVFRRLSWCYKTNLPHKFGKRIVISNLTGTFYKTDELDDLLRVLHVLDGKPEPDHRHGAFSLLNSANLLHRQQIGVVENAYVSIKTFKNGNGHITFVRPDLVDGLNRIIAKHYPGCLPAPK